MTTTVNGRRISVFTVVTPTGFERYRTFNWVEALRMQEHLTKEDRILHNVKLVEL